jgi:hypothetical protein
VTRSHCDKHYHTELPNLALQGLLCFTPPRKKNSRRIDAWAFKPEWFEPLWMKVFATEGKITSAEGLHDWGKGL